MADFQEKGGVDAYKNESSDQVMYVHVCYTKYRMLCQVVKHPSFSRIQCCRCVNYTSISKKA